MTSELWSDSKSDFLDTAFAAVEMLFTPTLDTCSAGATKPLQAATVVAETAAGDWWVDLLGFLAGQFVENKEAIDAVVAAVKGDWPEGEDGNAWREVATQVAGSAMGNVEAVQQVAQAAQELVDAVKLLKNWVTGSHPPSEAAAMATVPWWWCGAKVAADLIAATAVVMTIASIVNVVEKLLALISALNELDTSPMERSWSQGEMSSGSTQLASYNGPGFQLDQLWSQNGTSTGGGSTPGGSHHGSGGTYQGDQSDRDGADEAAKQHAAEQQRRLEQQRADQAQADRERQAEQKQAEQEQAARDKAERERTEREKAEYQAFLEREAERKALEEKYAAQQKADQLKADEYAKQQLAERMAEEKRLAEQQAREQREADQREAEELKAAREREAEQKALEEKYAAQQKADQLKAEEYAK
ncbi:MAG: hypothetical protein ACRCY9_17465, partial [Phycicoccus sp.]